VGVVSDAYNLFVINMVKNVIATIYPQTTATASAISIATIAGAVVGHLVFGTLADQIGRKVIFVITLSLIVVGSFGSATCVDSPHISVYTQLCIWLFILGIGIGGEYPLSVRAWLARACARAPCRCQWLARTSPAAHTPRLTRRRR